MTTNALNIIPVKTDYCPTMDRQAVKKKMAVPWGSHRFGDIILFDFNKNGIADHTGLVLDKAGTTVYTIEGNTGAGSNTNGGQVQIRPRTRSTVRRFVRPKYTKTVTPAMVIYTALGEVGTVESPKNSNKVKYNRWFYGKNISAFWCATFVCWNFGNVQAIPKVTKPKTKYAGAIPTVTVKACSKGAHVKAAQKFLNWYHPAWKLAVDGECGPKTLRAIMVYQNTEGLAVDANFGPKSAGRAKSYKSAAKAPATTPKKTTTAAKPAAKATLVSRRIEIDLTNQICTVYGIYSNKSSKALMSEFISSARKGFSTPTGNFKIQAASGGRKAKLRTAKLSGGTYGEFLCRFHGGKCMHTVPWKARNTKGYVYKGQFNKLGTRASGGCVRMPYKLARYIYEKCPVGTPVKVFNGKAGVYPMGKPKKYTATKNIDPTK